MARDISPWQAGVLNEWAHTIGSRDSDGFRILAECLVGEHVSVAAVAHNLAIDPHLWTQRFACADCPSPRVWLDWVVMLRAAHLWSHPPYMTLSAIREALGYRYLQGLRYCSLRTLGVIPRAACRTWDEIRVRQHIRENLILPHRVQLAIAPFLSASRLGNNALHYSKD